MKKKERIKISESEIKEIENLLYLNAMMFHGDWDSHIKYLQRFPKNSTEHKYTLPLVKLLKEKDKNCNTQHALLLDYLLKLLPEFSFEDLIRAYEYCTLLLRNNLYIQTQMKKKNNKSKIETVNFNSPKPFVSPN
jgi:hypothetical protein